MIAITHSHRSGTNLIRDGAIVFTFTTRNGSNDVLAAWFTRSKQLDLGPDGWREGIDLITGQYVLDHLASR